LRRVEADGEEDTGLVRRRKKGESNSSWEDEHDGLSAALVTLQNPTSGATEAYRMLRTNLFYARVDAPPKVVVLTSAGFDEGKSTTTANLGVALAQAGKETLILDCDLRKPTQHKIFGARGMLGLVDVLVGEREPEEVWHEPIPGLKLMPAGAPPPHPAEILTSRRLARFLERVRQEFDYVLVDTPPVGHTSEPASLGANADGVLLVLDSQHTRKGSLRQALRRLGSVGANVLGTIMNRYEAPSRGRTTEGGYYPTVPSEY
jgi:capsular exopolysaccharide synthesis family protein